MSDGPLRAQLAKLLDWKEAHVGFDAAVEGIPAEIRGRRPEGLPHSPWALLEHLRITQHDILDFCVNPAYEEMNWPDDYWPSSSQPTAEQWDKSIKDFRADREAMKRLAAEADLFAKIPHGTGQTYLREILLVADHTTYHVGQLVSVRQLLGAWPSA
jgi:hypothetical protein